jgi:hypothetical protein
MTRHGDWMRFVNRGQFRWPLEKRVPRPLEHVEMVAVAAAVHALLAAEDTVRTFRQEDGRRRGDAVFWVGDDVMFGPVLNGVYQAFATIAERLHEHEGEAGVRRFQKFFHAHYPDVGPSHLDLFLSDWGGKHQYEMEAEAYENARVEGLDVIAATEAKGG